MTAMGIDNGFCGIRNTNGINAGKQLMPEGMTLDFYSTQSGITEVRLSTGKGENMTVPSIEKSFFSSCN